MEQEIKNLNTKIIDGITIQMQLMPALKAAVLDKKVVCLLAPALGGAIKSQGLDTELDLETIINNVSAGLSNMSDEDYEDFLIRMFSLVTATRPGVGAYVLNEIDSINKIFEKKLLSIYKVLIEVMKYNGFSVFGLVEGGLGNLGMSILNTQSEKIETSGKKLETSEN